MRSVFFERPDAAELRQRLVGFAWVRVWLPAAFACVVIACESTQTMGAVYTSRLLRPLFEWIFGRMQDQTWGEIHHLIRKTGHFVGYGTVCLTFLRGWLLTLARREDLGLAAWRGWACLLGIISTAVVASCDEWHQTFLPGRTGLASDAILDTCGAVAMCGAVWVTCWAGRGARRD